jgi:hypothetical protein
MTGGSRIPQIGLLFLFLALGLTLAGCGGSKVSKANYDKVSKDMTMAQVHDILGAPTETNGTGDNKTEVWKSGNDTISVTYLGGKVAIRISSYDAGAIFGK